MDQQQAAKIAKRIARNPSDKVEIDDLTRIILASTAGVLPFEIVDATLDMLLGEADRVTPRMLADACRMRPVLPRRRPSLPPPADDSGPAERPIYWPGKSGRESFPLAEPDEKERERMRVYYASAALPATVINRPDLGIRPDHVAQANARRERAIETLEAKLAEIKPREAHLSKEEREIVADAQFRLEHLRGALGTGPERPLTSVRKTLQETLVRLGASMAREGRLRCAGCGTGELTKNDLNGAVAALMEAGARGSRAGSVYCDACRTGRPKITPPKSSPWLDPEVGLPPDELARLIAAERAKKPKG